MPRSTDDDIDDLDDPRDDDVDLEDDDDDDDEVPDRGTSPARRATLVAVPAALIAGIVMFFVVRANLPETDPTPDQPSPVTGVAIDEVDGSTDACANVVEGLPATLDDRAQRPVNGHPESLAWGDPPIVLVCGVAQPEDIDPSATLTVVNDVTWKIDENVDTTAYGLPGSNTVWTTVDREVFIAVAVPADLPGGAAISPISDVVAERLPSTETN